ncbi:hypothetical protein D3C83_114010 [compost metagenome]
MSAAIRPATTSPRMPAGRSVATSVGNAWSGAARWMRPDFDRAYAITPGTTKMNSGRILRNPAKMVPRRA